MTHFSSPQITRFWNARFYISRKSHKKIESEMFRFRCIQTVNCKWKFNPFDEVIENNFNRQTILHFFIIISALSLSVLLYLFLSMIFFKHYWEDGQLFVARKYLLLKRYDFVLVVNCNWKFSSNRFDFVLFVLWITNRNSIHLIRL